MKIIDKIIDITGSAISILNVILVILICIDVLMRYYFSTTEKWVIELEWHLFSLIFLIGASYTFKEDKHVRVDVFYNNFSNERKAWVNLLGNLFFLIPWCMVVIYTSYKYAGVSFLYREISPDPGGLPARYIIKYAIALGFSLLLLQAISNTILNFRNIYTARWS